MTSRLPIIRAPRPATDFAAALFEDVDLFVLQILAASPRLGVPAIQNRQFRGCRISGPAVLLASTGTVFDDCNFGDPRGDVRNLLYRPMGERAIGTVALINCSFDGCEFFDIGFTGEPAFIDSLLALKAPPQFGTLS